MKLKSFYVTKDIFIWTKWWLQNGKIILLTAHPKRANIQNKISSQNTGEQESNSIKWVFKQRMLKKRNTNGSEFSAYTCKNGQDQWNKWQLLLVRIWSNGNKHSSIICGIVNLYSHYGSLCGDTSERWQSTYLKIQLYHSKHSTKGDFILLQR